VPAVTIKIRRRSSKYYRNASELERRRQRTPKKHRVKRFYVFEFFVCFLNVFIVEKINTFKKNKKKLENVKTVLHGVLFRRCSASAPLQRGRALR